jgi:hypothetical protein
MIVGVVSVGWLVEETEGFEELESTIDLSVGS